MYKLSANGVQRLGDGAFIPNDPTNPDWRAYQRWLAEGNEPAAADAPPSVAIDHLTLIARVIADLVGDRPIDALDLEAIKAIAESQDHAPVIQLHSKPES